MIPNGYSVRCNHQNEVVFAVYEGFHPDPYAIWRMQEDVLYDGKYFSDAKEAIDYFNEITHLPCQSKPVDIAEEKIDIEGDTLAERLRFLRKSKGLTQKELASQSGISYGSITSYEKGLRKPNYRSLMIFEDFYNIKANDLIRKEELIKKDNSVTNLSNLPFHLKLKELRKLKKYTQEDLSKETGVGYQAIVNYEIGRRKPTGENLLKLAKALEYPADKLIDDQAESKGEKTK